MIICKIARWYTIRDEVLQTHETAIFSPVSVCAMSQSAMKHRDQDTATLPHSGYRVASPT